MPSHATLMSPLARARIYVVWVFLTVAALFGPCRPPVGPAAALAAEATP